MKYSKLYNFSSIFWKVYLYEGNKYIDFNKIIKG